MSTAGSFPRHGRWILAATTLASSTAFLLGAAVNIAIPSIQKSFGANIAGIEWVTNAQLLFLSTLLLIGGSLGDYFGRKRIFVLGILVFSVASIFAGFSPTIGFLITFQAVQGIGAALMIPQSLAIINASFPENQRGRIIGWWAGISGAIATIGPWLGGWLVEQFSWRAVFFINVPISAAALVIAAIFISESEKNRGRRLDWLGTAIIFLGLLGVAYGLIQGQISGWTSSAVLTGLAGGGVAVAVFVFAEMRRRAPLIPLEIFKNALVGGANGVTILLYFALNGILFFLVLNLQQIQGYSPSSAGLALLTSTIIIAAFSGPAGSLGDRIGPRLPMIVGPLLVAGGAMVLSLLGDQPAYFSRFFPGLVLVGAGMALVIAPLTKSALLVPAVFSGVASGVNNAVARFAALLAIAVLGAVMLFTFSAQLQDSLRATDLSPAQQTQVLDQADKLGGVEIPADFAPPAQTAAHTAVANSFLYGFRWAMAICAALAAGASVVAFFTIRNPVQPIKSRG